MGISIEVVAEEWPLAKPFVISRGSKACAEVVVVTLSDGTHTGRGECVPYARYGDTVEGVGGALQAMASAISCGVSRVQLQKMMPAGAARNALDCALWDLTLKQEGRSIWQMLGREAPVSLPSVQTISICDMDTICSAASSLRDFPVIKVKLGAEGVTARIKAVHAYAPNAKLVIDANESWSLDLLNTVAAELQDHGVVMIEQPLPADNDGELSGYTGPVPLCADESCHTCEDLEAAAKYYQFVNIKLDKTGGLTEALLMQEKAKSMGMGIMVGSMVSTSLALAPALPLAAAADFVDLDSPGLLAADRAGGFSLAAGRLGNLQQGIWG